MNTDEINIAIAEICGWKRLNGQPQNMLWPCDSYVTGKDGMMMKQPGVSHRHGVPPPNYHGSLDAMHEAENLLTAEQQYTYWNGLVCICNREAREKSNFALVGVFYQITATAPQRAEAFLRVFGKWVESANRKHHEITP